MKIVIDIPEEEYQNYLKMRPAYPEGVFCYIEAIQNGTSLPKGHGNLIQREDAEALFRNARKALYELSRKEPINDFQTRELMLLNAEQIVHLIEPIIEADKGEEE